MILVVAPYSPIELSKTPPLGAARKLEVVVGLLSRIDDVVLVNSAHNQLERRPLQVEQRRIDGALVTMIVPPTRVSRPLGKLQNLFQIREVLDALPSQKGPPKLAWLYNGYAFECRFGTAVQKRFGCPLVLEFEDWHFARPRGLSPKPYIDWLSWKFAIDRIGFAFAVNAELRNVMRRYDIPTHLLPGIVPPQLSELCERKPPFKAASSDVRVGYFGGLSQEKGVDKLLEVIERAPSNISFDISGAGSLEPAVKEIAGRLSDRVHYHGRVSDAQLYELIGGCDVIVNPHRPIEQMGGGVFPFKVVEAIASGRLLVSTSAPRGDLEDVLAGTCFYDGSAPALFESLVNARNYYELHQPRIINAAKAAQHRFSSQSVAQIVEDLMGRKFSENPDSSVLKPDPGALRR